MLDSCTLQLKWLLHPQLIATLLAVQDEVKRQTGRDLTINSGHRDCSKQTALKKTNPYAASCETSTHTSCPATGVDVQIGYLPTRVQKAKLVELMVMAGLRWGATAMKGANLNQMLDGKEWNHFDLGPRR